jgi:CHASE3 domain sensor protein
VKSVRRVSRWTLAAALVVLLAIVGVSFTSVLRLPTTLGWVERTHDVIAHLDVIEREALQAESARRGYLLRGEPRHRQAFGRSKESLRAQFYEAHRLLADNSSRRSRTASSRRGKFATRSTSWRAVSICCSW